ncbi:MAG: hypothetical protein ACI4XR_00270 [Bacilli bacterium]
MSRFENKIINESTKFYEKLKLFYSSAKAEGISLSSFDDEFKDNKSRIDFIIKLIKLDENGKLSNKMHQVLEENYEYFTNFIKGQYFPKPLTVPKDIMKNIKETGIPVIEDLPSEDDLSLLLDLIERNYTMCSKIFANKKIIVKLPSDSIHHDIYEQLEIKEDNIAHLLGLTSSNSLINLYISKTGNTSPAINMPKFFISFEGKNILIEENEKIRDFVKNFNSKDNELFKQEFKKKFGYDYPLIEFNKLIIKNISLFNYESLNFNEIIVDHIEKDINCDLFVPHYNGNFSETSSKYKSWVEELIDLYYRFANLSIDKQNEVLKDFPQFINFFCNKTMIEQLKDNFSSKFLTNFNISNPDLTKQINNLKNRIMSLFDYDLSVIGFRTINMHSFNGGKDIVFEKKCTSILTETTPTILERYYKDGRVYFIDKIVSSDGKILKISNAKDELEYLERLDETSKEYQDLYNKIIELDNITKEYSTFLDNNHNKTR